VDGGELQLAWMPLHGLQLTAAATYLAAKVIDSLERMRTVSARTYAGSAVPIAEMVDERHGGL